MVHDFEEGGILGELQDLDEEIEAIQGFIDAGIPGHRQKEFKRTVKRLQREKERQQMRLGVHRQKVKDSGIKY